MKFKNEKKLAIRDAVFEVFECPSPGPLNEALDTIVEISNQSFGLSRLSLRDFPENAEFDGHLLKRLVNKTQNI